MTEQNPTPPPTPPPAGPVNYAAGDYGTLPVAQSQDDKTMGMLAHLLAIFTWFLGPLIIWLIKKDQSQFVNDQGKEALNFQIFATICMVGCLIVVCIPFVNILVIGAVHITRIVFCIVAALAANKGEAYRYPLNWRIIK